MHPPAHHRRLRQRHWLVWWMVAAVACGGLLSTLLQLAAPRHVHLPQTVDAMHGWVDFRRAEHGAAMGAAQVDAHHSAQRHVHAVGTRSVVAIDDSAADDGGAPGAGSLAPARLEPLRVAGAAATVVAWHGLRLLRPASPPLRRLERPPRV